MSQYLFVGPTLRPEDVAELAPDMVCLPPAAQGDVLRIARREPDAIGLVDGYFSGAPSVWHKEILWALAQGIPVFGSASMGALRAAELHGFGMIGIGRIFEAFRDGLLEDDDEVAVVHGPAELQFAPLSVPMVNIRATLDRAQLRGMLTEKTRAVLQSAAKSIFFAERTWSTVLAEATARRADPVEIASLEAWLPGEAVDQKRADGREMLLAMRDARGRGAPPGFRFEWTHHWDRLVAEAITTASREADPGLAPSGVLEELRLQGSAPFEAVKSKALLRLHASLEAARRDRPLSPAALRVRLDRLRRDLALTSRAELEHWMQDNDLDEPGLARLLERETERWSIPDPPRPVLEPFLLDELRVSGAYAPLAARARDKAELVDASPAAGLPRHGPAATFLRVWFCETRLARPLPEDIEDFARTLGFDSAAELDHALWREWMYSQSRGRSVLGD